MEKIEWNGKTNKIFRTTVRFDSSSALVSLQDIHNVLTLRVLDTFPEITPSVEDEGFVKFILILGYIQPIQQHMNFYCQSSVKLMIHWIRWTWSDRERENTCL